MEERNLPSIHHARQAFQAPLLSWLHAWEPACMMLLWDLVISARGE
jgi:hypothetical protein